MSNYIKWNEQTIDNFSVGYITNQYKIGYLFGRPHKGYMYQTRSLRINLAEFDTSSENRRILRKTEDIGFKTEPLPYSDYHWSIGKLGKDFYDEKFGSGTFTANKIKEMMTDPENSNFNLLLSYYEIQEPTKCIAFGDNPPIRMPAPQAVVTESSLGYAICYANNEMIHYSYPFYDLDADKNTGMAMMLRAIVWAKHEGKKYIYLGSATRSRDIYKLQFLGLEWFDGKKWVNDIDILKKILKEK